MTIHRARKLLAGFGDKFSDEELEVQLNYLRTIARIAARETIKKYGKRTQSSCLLENLRQQASR